MEREGAFPGKGMACAMIVNRRGLKEGWDLKRGGKKVGLKMNAEALETFLRSLDFILNAVGNHRRILREMF